MASILPVVLEEISESVSVDVTFTGVMDVNETLVDISITDYRPNNGITVDGSRFYGQYIDSFDLGEGGLKYRDTRDNSYHTVSRFEDLPSNPVNGHVYLFKAPSPLTTDYTYTVTLNYTYQDPLAIPPLPAEDRQLVQVFTQTVKGQWDTWGQQLRDYIAAGN